MASKSIYINKVFCALGPAKSLLLAGSKWVRRRGDEGSFCDGNRELVESVKGGGTRRATGLGRGRPSRFLSAPAVIERSSDLSVFVASRSTFSVGEKEELGGSGKSAWHGAE